MLFTDRLNYAPGTDSYRRHYVIRLSGGVILSISHLLDGVTACADNRRLAGMDPACQVLSQPYHRLSFIDGTAGRRAPVCIEQRSCC